MNFDAAFIVYKTENVVAGNGVAAIRKDVFVYACFGDDAG